MRYLAFTLPRLRPISNNLKLEGVTLTDAINSAGEMNAKLPAAVAYGPVQVEGEDRSVELIREFGTFIIAQRGNMSRGYIVFHADEEAEDQDTLALQCFGIGAIPEETPWLAAAKSYVNADPLRVFREIWAHVTSYPDTLEVSVDRVSSPIRVGEPEDDEGDSEGPLTLNWFETNDLGQEIDNLATETPFEWREHTYLDLDSDAPPSFRIEVGYPVIEPVKRDLLFAVGTNVIAPDQDADEDFCTEVLVRGAGEGSAKKRGEAKRRGADRLRRVKVIEDQSLTSTRRANQRAAEVLGISKQDKFWANVTVIPHPATSPEEYGVGDIIEVKGLTVWGRHSQTCRIVERTHHISTDNVDLTLEPWD